MSGSSFCHLHVHSEYSLLDGANRISALPKKIRELGQTAVALTDHGVMFGAVPFFRACEKEGIKPVLGCEIYMAVRTRFDRDPVLDRESSHLVLLVKNAVGYDNLCRLVSRANTEGFYGRMRADDELLSLFHEGLVCLSGCLSGKISRFVLASDYNAAKEYALYLDGLFGRGNFYLELQNHGLPDQEKVNRSLLLIHDETGIPLVATNDAHYAEKTDAELQNILVCIRTGSTESEGSALRFPTDEFYLKSEQEMVSLFKDYPDACANTAKIAEMCDFSFSFGKTHLPRFDCPKGKTADETLSVKAEEGLKNLCEKRILPAPGIDLSEYRERMEYELSVIRRMGYSDYFLITSDYVNYAKKHGVAVGPGRGSGAGSLVALLTGVTEIDPLRYGLLFERFLNPERISMPDFDIDFCDEKRDEVFEYVRKKYGDERVCHIVAFGTLAPRAVLRDVGRVIGLSFAQTDLLCAQVPQAPGVTLQKAKNNPGLISLIEENPAFRRCLDLSIRMEGIPRHTSRHAAGVVITDKPLENYLPIALCNGDIVTQYDMSNVEALGLLKFDFLGLRYLTVIDHALAKIREKDPDFSLSDVPLDRDEVFAMLAEGNTFGVFQIESEGMTSLMTTMAPKTLEEIMIAIALFRPGPMKSIGLYLENRAHPEKVTYKTELLRPILSPTCGVIVYQEQVMQIFRTLAGYPLGRADLVRKAMAKKKADVLENERNDFVSGCEKNNVPKSDAQSLFDEMASFAEYAFNKSHSVAYGVLTYRTAYLKCFYPYPYYAALLSSVASDPEKTGAYIEKIKKLGISVSRPDINRSGALFSSDEGGIVYGLSAVKFVGVKFVEAILSEREKGPFLSFEDFVLRMSKREIGKKQIEYLIKAGAFDSLGKDRAVLLEVYGQILDVYAGMSRKTDEAQVDLFSFDASERKGSFVYPDLPPMSFRDRLRYEKEAAGVYFSGHPLDEYNLHASGFAYSTISELQKRSFGEPATVSICVWIVERREVKTRKGEKMAILKGEDRTGEIEIPVFPAVFAENEYNLVPGRALLATGICRGRDEHGRLSLILRSCVFLRDNDGYREERSANVPEKPTQKLYLRLSGTNPAIEEKIFNLISIFEGSVPVLLFRNEKNCVPYEKRCAPNPTFLNELALLIGKGNVVLYSPDQREGR